MMFPRLKFTSLFIHLYRRLYSSTTNIVIKENLPAAAYKSEYVEKNKYESWTNKGLFKAENSTTKPTFSMILPPPNVTGKLHLGHALACTVQDVIARRERSLGQNVLWLPGTDHAGIATQTVVEKYLASKKNLSRHEMTREKFNSEVWKWKEKHGISISSQLRKMGFSLDWSRETFTMDPKHTKAVNAAFIKLFQKGLIYRKKALVNWCNQLKSTVSDIEVDTLLVDGPTKINLHDYEQPVEFGLLYSFAYKIFETNEEVVVSTTMPETMLGDTAIAVHPHDERYSHLMNKRVFHPFRNQTIPIIFDEFVDMKFSTGAVKLTPAHSKVDFEIAHRHNLPLMQVIDEDGLMQNTDYYDKLKRYECRKVVVQKLKELGFLREVTPHQMNLPVCSRTGNVIDHLPKEQWFLSCSKLNKKAADLVKSGELKIEPEKYVKNWLNWTEDDRDWCISRQLWWGHQIPAFKCTAGDNMVWIAETTETAAQKEASKYLRTLPDNIHVERDSDVLDTWFSSGIYPFAALGWPEKYSQDFKKFYPLSLMATGHDILGFWVHRMVILGLELTDMLPFKKVLLHGIICDTRGAKMSKSKGNVIDPNDVIDGSSLDSLREKTEDMHRSGVLSKEELDKALAYHKTNFPSGIPKCGVDALRFTLLSQDIKSHFVGFDIHMCHANTLFCNKIWQSIKYMQLSYAKLNACKDEITCEDLTYFDTWILSRLAHTVEKVNKSMDDHDFHLATKSLRALIYGDFCDVYLEATKPGFTTGSLKTGYAHAHTLAAVLNTSLRCLNPFMIYLTEELIRKIPDFENNVIHNFDDSKKMYFDFPQSKDFNIWKNDILEKNVERVLSTIFLVRELKGLYGISNKLRPSVSIKTTDETLKSDLDSNKAVVLNLARCSNVDFEDRPEKKYVKGFIDKNTEVSVEVIADDVDTAVLAARGKLQNRIKKVEDILNKLETKFSSDRYLASVPEWTQVMDREKLMTKKEELKQLQRLI